MRRPSYLAEVGARAGDRRAFHQHVADFLDEFALGRRADMLIDEPDLLAERFDGGEVTDADLAAVAVSLARDIGCTPPTWVWKQNRKLKIPWFASPGRAIRATRLAESPAPFRERNLFVSENALSRA